MDFRKFLDGKQSISSFEPRRGCEGAALRYVIEGEWQPACGGTSSSQIVIVMRYVGGS